MNDDKLASGGPAANGGTSAASQAAASPTAASQAAALQAVPLRVLSRADELKALADPTRLAILEKLMASGRDLPVMSVKELAEVLGEPQTKLYRHVRQLESVGLIRVAASRMVSGILEQRYQAAQHDLQLAPISLRENVDEAQALARTVLDRFRDGFFAAYLTTGPGSPGWQDGDSWAGLMNMAAKLSPARAAEVKTKLAEVIALFNEPDSDDPDAEDMDVLIGYYQPPASGQA